MHILKKSLLICKILQ